MNKTRQQTKFCNELQSFLRSVIRQRVRLVEANKSLKNESAMRNQISKLIPYTSLHFTEKGAAIWIIRHAEDIHLLIPPQAKATFIRLGEISQKAHRIINPEIPFSL